VTQNGFTETGAQSLNLTVAQQTTQSLRTVFGAQLGAAMDVGLRDKIAGQLRLGWSHEFADTARPVSASFVGAPALPFTVFGAAPTRDGAVVGFSLSTAVAEAMGVYLRYEGNIAGQDSSHALTAGLRMSW
jgi:outer membrane autotransporter protein